MTPKPSRVLLLLLHISLSLIYLKAAIPQYRIEELILPEGCDSSGYTYLINDNGDIVILACGGAHYKKRGEDWQLIQYEGEIVYPYNMNNRGVVTGESSRGDAIVWFPGSTNATLISVNEQRCVTRGVSDEGIVLFMCRGEPHFYKDGIVTAFQDSTYPFPTENVYPVFISNGGTLHGWYQKDENVFHPMNIKDGELFIHESVALSLAQTRNYIDGNDLGQSVATLDLVSATNVYGIGMTGTINPESFLAERINNLGTAVGISPPSVNIKIENNAAIWNQEYGVKDLNELLATSFDKKLMSARSINNQGQIICIGLEGPFNLYIKSYLLTEIETKSVIPYEAVFGESHIEIVVRDVSHSHVAGIERSYDLRNWFQHLSKPESLNSGDVKFSLSMDKTVFYRAVEYKDRYPNEQ